MRISASVEYGARILVQLAKSSSGQDLNAEKISALENIPRAYVDQILLKLKRAGLVESHRGVQGGHRLAKPTSDITIGMMMRAVEGSIFDDVCEKYATGEHRCTHTAGCDIKPAWRRLTQLVEDYLDHLTLGQLLTETKPCGALPVFPISSDAPAPNSTGRSL
jgi:Rrf2 family iron-sulfur cluster assembly transcriptional regulator